MSNTPAFLDMLITTQQNLISDVRDAGGIDFDVLCQRPYDARGNKAQFRRIGGVAFRGIELGFKHYKRPGRLQLDGFAEEVATLGHVGSQGQKYMDMLPRIHFEIRDGSGMSLGILTDDFTRGGRRKQVGEVALHGLETMFSRANVIEEDNSHGVVGIFQDNGSTGLDNRSSHIIDVESIYAYHKFDTSFFDLPDWLSQEIRLPAVTENLDALRISTVELAA